MDKRMRIRFAERVFLGFAILFIAALLFSGLLSRQVLADETILPIANDNVDRIWLIKSSYLIATENGYSRILKTDSGIFVEDYNDSFEIVSRRSIKTELRGYAGFFNGEDNYYFVFYDFNEEEDNDKEVIRVVKYSKDWKRLSAANLKGDNDDFGHDTRYPFDYGNCSMEEVDGKLYLATGHQGYVDPSVGQGHQGFLMYEIDESSMTGRIISSDFSHSFSQHLTVKDKDNIYVLEECEGYRATVVSRLSETTKNRTESVIVLKYGGQRTSSRAISTRASADGISYSSNNIITVGSSIDQSKYEDYDYNDLYNLYVSVTPVNDFTGEATSVKWLRSFTTSQGFKGIKLVKINNDRFLIMWEEYVSEGTPSADDPMGGYILHYLFVDGNGDTITSEMTASVPLSDCEPVLKNGYVSWCASSNGYLQFVSINTSTGSVKTKDYRIAGEKATWSFKDGTLYINGTGKIADDFISYVGDINSIDNLVISEGITEIGDNAFSHIQSESVVLPKSITKIGAGAFSYSTVLKDIYIYDNVTEIGEDAFFTGYWSTNFERKIKIVTIHCNKNTYASEYAQTEGVKCDRSHGGYEKKKVSVDDLTIEGQEKYEYAGTEIAAYFTIKDDQFLLTKETDYTISFSKNINVGTASAVITGKGDYYGSRTVNFEIIGKPISKTTISTIPNKTYTGSAITPSVTVSDFTNVLKNGKDYTVSYSNNVKAGTATVTVTGKGNYSGTQKATFEIYPFLCEIKDGTMYISGSGKIPDDYIDALDIDMTGVNSLVIKEGVTEIGDRAFSGINVSTVVLPKGVTKIGFRAFALTRTLKDIYIPDSVTEIGNEAFWSGYSWMDNNEPVYYVTIHCNKGSYASKYAENIGINCNTSDGGYDKPRMEWVRENGKWIYFDANSLKVTGWQNIDRSWYFFDDKGIMQTGWIQDGNNWYFLGSSGSMTTGWLQYGKTWYYLNSSGAMATGWKQIGKIWYYFRSSGAMATGWIQDGDKWYYFENSGTMATGWIESGGSWYYLGSSGAMVTGWLNVEDNWYYMNLSGSMTTGWLQSGKTWYYLNKSGHMVTGTQTINGKSYEFDSDGRWIE